MKRLLQIIALCLAVGAAVQAVHTAAFADKGTPKEWIVRGGEPGV